MFNVGGGEILVILVIALLVLGPTRLPGAARQVGRALAEFRRVSSGVERDIRDALDTDELREGMAAFKEVTNLGSTVKSELASAATSFAIGSSQTSSSSSRRAAKETGSAATQGDAAAHGAGTAVPPPDGLYGDDRPDASSTGAAIPSPRGMVDILLDSPSRSSTGDFEDPSDQ